MLLPFRRSPYACRRASLSARGRRGNWEARSSGARLILVQVRFIAALGAFALATACSPYVRRGEALYYEGRFIEAAEVFELTEQNLQGSAPEVCAEYSLYRGLTFLRLDDLESARVWLGRAQVLDQKNPGMLSQVQRALLARGRSELDQRLAAAPVAPHPGTRFAASEEPAPATRTPIAPGGNGHRAIAPE
jgi:hypothetical protein